jgi:xanthine dehydrogenase accessory factor
MARLTISLILESGARIGPGGEPQPLGGVARARSVYAPLAGFFETQQSAVVVSIASTSLCAPIVGVIRGLTHDGVPVALGTKVIEIDPRGNPSAAFGLGARPQGIAEGVLVAMTLPGDRHERSCGI